MMNQAVLRLLAGSLTALQLTATGDALAKLNVILFLADDLGSGDMDCYRSSAATRAAGAYT